MGGASSAHGIFEMHTRFWSEMLKERGISEHLDVGGKIILE
jgi:hypothetical protein